MNFISITVLGLLGLGAAALLILLPTAIVRNLNRGLAYRRQLRETVMSMPLGKLLVARGANVTQYLHDQRIVQVHAQIRKCAGCGTATTCDEDLSRSAVRPAIPAYCGNAGTLQAVTS